jgi:alanine racemase
VHAAVRIAALPGVSLEGVYTHLPFATEGGMRWAQAASLAFSDFLRELTRLGLSVPVRQALSSSGVLAGMALDATNTVCIGNALYGLPAVGEHVADLSEYRPVFHALKARVIQVTRHPHDRQAGSGGDRTYSAGMVTAVIPVGVAHGYWSADTSQLRVLIRGQRVPVVRITTGYSTIDVSGLDSVTVGDETVLIGKQGDGIIRLDEAAVWLGIPPTELLITQSGRLPYVYLEGTSDVGPLKTAME